MTRTRFDGFAKQERLGSFRAAFRVDVILVIGCYELRGGGTVREVQVL